MHTTYFKVPAGTQVNITILGYDGCTPLRNPYWGQVTGTFTQSGQKNVADVSIFNGKKYGPVVPVSRSTRGPTARCSTRSRYPASG